MLSRWALRAKPLAHAAAAMPAGRPGIKISIPITQQWMSTSPMTPPRFELELHEVVAQLGDLRARTPAERSEALVKKIYPSFEKLVAAYVAGRLQPCAEVRYDPDIIKALLPSENFDGLLDGGANEYTLRKHVRDVMRAYLGAINEARPIRVTNHAQFILQMQKLGLNLGPASEDNKADGNVLVMASLARFLALLAAVTYVLG